MFKPYSGVSTLILFFDKKYKDKSIIYLKSIENDGYEKGEGRLPVDEDDLPVCKNDIDCFRKYLDGEISLDEASKIISGKIIDKNSYDNNYDFHPYSYYDSDLSPNKKISDIFNIEKGTVQSSKREEGEYTFITASDNWLTHSEYTHDCEALIFVFGAGGSLGKVHYTNNRKFVVSDLCWVLTPKDSKNTNLKYYYAYFNSRRRDIVQRLARGTNKKAINDTRFSDYLVSYPSKIEQDRIGNMVDSIFNKINEYKSKIEEENSKLESLV